MDEGSQVNASPASPSREALEDLVYRSGIGERVLPAPSRWLTVPSTLALAGLFGAMAFLMGRRPAAGRPEPRTVDVVLQEPAAAPIHDRPAPAAPAPRPQTPQAEAPHAAPAPPVPLAAPPAPIPETAPDTPPRELPREDLSRQTGGNAGSGAWTGPGPGGAGGPGAVQGGGGAAPAPKVMDVDISQVKEKSRPPELTYPPLARSARIQGIVVVSITVGTDGVPVSARALEGPTQLRAAAEAWAMGWRFFPYQQGGVALVSRFNLSITFRIK